MSYNELFTGKQLQTVTPRPRSGQPGLPGCDVVSVYPGFQYTDHRVDDDTPTRIVLSERIDAEDSRLFGPLTRARKCLVQVEAAGWLGFCDFEAFIKHGYGESDGYAKATFRLYRAATEAECTAFDAWTEAERQRKEAEQITRERAEFKRLKAKLEGK